MRNEVIRRLQVILFSAALAPWMVTDLRAEALYATNTTGQSGWTLSAIVPSPLTRENDWLLVRLSNTVGTNKVYSQREFIRRNPFVLEVSDSVGNPVPQTALGTLLFDPESSSLANAAVAELWYSQQILPSGKTREEGFHISEFFQLHAGRFLLRASAKVRIQRPGFVPITVDVPFTIKEWEPAR
jgi:hypothetical protein